jgi:hypothetical protein
LHPNTRESQDFLNNKTLILESSEKLPEISTTLGFLLTKLDDYLLEVVLESDINITQVLKILSEHNIKSNA